MKSKNDFIVYTVIGTMIGAGLGILVSKKMCKKTGIMKKTAGKALRAAGSFVEHMSF